MRLRRASALALLAALAACGRADERNAGAPNGATLSDAEIADVADAPNGADPAAAEPPLDALADVRVGMTIAQLRAAGFTVSKDPYPVPGSSCGYADIAERKDLSFMLDGDTVVRIEVDRPGHATLGGVEVGMSEAEALRRLGSRARVEPHPYTGPVGHYLVVHRPGAPFGLILETDGKTVETWRIGRWEQVQWVESCS